MRKLAAAALAVPVVAVLYIPLLLRRSVVARVGIAVGVGALLGLGAIGLLQPVRTVATPPLPPIVAVPGDAFEAAIAAGVDLHRPVRIEFSEPMDRTSIAASVRVQPMTALDLSWDPSGTILSVAPETRWAPGTYHTITIGAGALAETGRPMSGSAHSAFVTRAATSGSIRATAVVGDLARVSSGFRITFDNPVDIASLRDAIRITPAIEGRIVPAPRGSTSFTFEPATPLAAGTRYDVALVGVVDASGVMIQDRLEVAIATTTAPRVVRFRPVDGTSNVDQEAALSVRFSESMDRRSAKRAFVISTGGKPVAGTYRFAESDTVVVFDPTDPLPYGAEIELRVDVGALSATGTPLSTPQRVKIRVEEKPRPAVRATPSTSSSSGGGSVGGGSWAAVETYYLNLMNCTRTGGLVTSSGGCSSPGGRAVAPLMLDSGISSKVARPYAKKLAVNNQCSHFIGGNPGDRLRAAGYTSYIWAENLGCRSGDPYAAVLGSHLYFQSEKSYNGGHYVNMMNAKYDRAGIGVWVSGGRVRLVVDFYHPL